MVSVGVVITNPLPPGAALPDIAALAAQAEDLGLDCIWAEEELVVGDAAVTDCVTVMAACAAVTQRIKVGSAIMAPSLRPMAWALKQVATLSLLAGGQRLQLGVGLGGRGADVYALAVAEHAARRQKTDEFLGILAAARSGQPTVPGLPYDTLLLRPAVAVPQVWVGGSSPAALARAVRFGDGWLSGLQAPAEFAASLRRLRELAEEAERPCPLAGIVAHVAVGEGERARLAARCADVMSSLYGVPPGRAEQLSIAGAPPEVAGQLAEFVESGADHIAVHSDVLPWSQTWPLVAEVRALLVHQS